MIKILGLFTFLSILFMGVRYEFDSKFTLKKELFHLYNEKIKLIEDDVDIILGDSRVLNGVNPIFNTKKTINFAFNSQTYTKEYLNYVLKRAKKETKIYIGLSIQSLTDLNLDEEFKKTIRTNRSYTQFLIDELLLSSVDLFSINGSFKRNKNRYSYMGYLLLGNNEVTQSAANAYVSNYKRYKFNETRLESLFNFIHKLKDQRVIVFLTPSLANKYDFDKNISGISKRELLKFFETENITVHQYPKLEELKYFDGDHLVKESSDKFSKWLFTF